MIKLLIVFFLFSQFLVQGVEEKYFEQKLDHSGQYPGTWKQRYMENGEYFKPGGPIFISLGGTPVFAKVSEEAVTKGSMVHHAKEQGAFILQLEARYFGKSRPTEDLSTENLHKYLSIENSLSDSKEFISWYKSQPQFKDSKVVAFGHVYLGSRIIQHMRRDPGLIDIGVVSSALVETKFEIPEYTLRELEILRGINAECAATVHDALLCFDKMINGETCEGHKIDDLKETFNLCADEDPSKPLDNAGLIAEMHRMLSFVVLLDNPTAPYNVHKMCDAMGDTSQERNHVDKLGDQVKEVLKMLGRPCLEFRFDEVLKSLQNTTWEHSEETKFARTGLFSRCKYSMTLLTPEGLDLPESTLENYRNYILEKCNQAFGLSKEDVKTGTENTNKKYGMRGIPSKCTIFMTEGEDLIKSLEITTQEEAGKCNAYVESQDGGITADDIDAEEVGELEYGRGLKAAQIKVGKLIDQWLKTGDCCTQ